METGGKNGTEEFWPAGQPDQSTPHHANSVQPADFRGNLDRVRAERSTAPTMHYRVFLGIKFITYEENRAIHMIRGRNAS